MPKVDIRVADLDGMVARGKLIRRPAVRNNAKETNASL